MYLPDPKGRLRPVVGEWTGAQVGQRQFNPWLRRATPPPIEVAAEELASLLGLTLAALRSEGRTAAQRAGRRNLALLLREKGYRLYEIGAVLGAEQAAVSRLLLRARGCEEDEAEYWSLAAARASRAAEALM